MLGKVVNGVLITPSENERKKIVITNPSDDVLKYVMGYKNLTVDEEPEYNVETQYLQPEFEETETDIVQHWAVKDIEEIEVEEDGGYN